MLISTISPSYGVGYAGQFSKGNILVKYISLFVVLRCSNYIRVKKIMMIFIQNSINVCKAYFSMIFYAFTHVSDVTVINSLLNKLQIDFTFFFWSKKCFRVKIEQIKGQSYNLVLSLHKVGAYKRQV